VKLRRLAISGRLPKHWWTCEACRRAPHCKAASYPSSLEIEMPNQNDDAVPQIAVPSSVLEAQTKQFLACLEKAFERPSKTGTDQDRYILALRAVAEFLDAIGGKELYGANFGELAKAIADLEQGTVHPLLQAQSFGKGRAPDPSSTWERRAFTALAMEALIGLGWKREQAAGEIVRRCTAVVALTRAKKPDKARAAVLSWYENFRRGEIKNKISVTSYDRLQRDMSLLCGSDPERLGRAVDFFLQRAADGALCT
jgi:hypothetical protein